MGEINNEMLKALGNLNIEGLDVSREEYEVIAKILLKYKEKLGSDAVDSLLYALSIGSKLEEKEKNK